MKIVDEFSLYPHASLTGRPGLPQIDTGWDMLMDRGPGRLYVHPQEAAEIIRHAHELEEPAAVLAFLGYVRREEHRAAVNAADARAAAAEERAAAAEAERDQVLATVKLLERVPDVAEDKWSGRLGDNPANVTTRDVLAEVSALNAKQRPFHETARHEQPAQPAPVKRGPGRPRKGL